MNKKFYIVTDQGIEHRELTKEQYDEYYDRAVVFDTFEEAAMLAIASLSDRVKELEEK